MEIGGVDLSELDIHAIGSWPKKLRMGLFVGAFILTLVAGYFLVLNDKLAEMDMVKNDLTQKMSLFKDTQEKVANLQAYKDEVRIVERELDKLTEQLPQSNEMASLLDDITQQAQISDLKFVAIKPVQQESKEFYQEASIELELIGSYNGLGDFSTRVANMKRIVTFHGFTIQKEEKGNGILTGALSISVLAKTYWASSIGGDSK